MNTSAIVMMIISMVFLWGWVDFIDPTFDEKS